MESMILHNTSIQKQYQNYLIKLSSDLDLINILIENDNRIYESNCNLEYLHQHQLFHHLHHFLLFHQHKIITIFQKLLFKIF